MLILTPLYTSWVQEGPGKKCTKMKFSIKDLFSKCDQICSFLRIWSHLLKESLIKNLIFRAVSNLNVFEDKFIVYMITFLYSRTLWTIA